MLSTLASWAFPMFPKCYAFSLGDLVRNAFTFAFVFVLGLAFAAFAAEAWGGFGARFG